MQRVRSAKSGLQPLHVVFIVFEATEKPHLGSRAPLCLRCQVASLIP
jgi:hypothetical protein